MRYGIVKSSVSSAFIVFPSYEEASEYAKEENKLCPYGKKEFYAVNCYDPFMTLEKFNLIPEFQGW